MARTFGEVAAAAGPDWIYDHRKDCLENTATGICITSECARCVLEARTAREPGAFGIPGLGVVLEDHQVKEEVDRLVARFGGPRG